MHVDPPSLSVLGAPGDAKLSACEASKVSTATAWRLSKAVAESQHVPNKGCAIVPPVCSEVQ